MDSNAFAVAVRGAAIGIEIPQSSFESREKILSIITALPRNELGQPTVNSKAEAQAAVDAASSAKKALKDVETVRVDLKAAPLELCNTIDKLAKDFSTPLKDAVKPIEDALSDWNRREAIRIAAEEAARQKKIREAQEAEAEAIRVAQETARMAAEAQAAALAQVTTQLAESQEDPELAGLLKAQAEEAAATAAAEATAAANAIAAAATAKADAVMWIPKPEERKVAGTSTRVKWTYRIDDPVKVHSLHPEFFTLVEKKQVINGVIGKDFVCEGMEVWEDTKTNVR